ncbi:hypothetical protein AB0E69_27960 [Kribbella sp. NPDC026611]|uniref:hypothetical protein n=1 Tax=Kribbella sp. NPDC026611 TaxID=3154911 RepID=UPI0033FBC433
MDADAPKPAELPAGEPVDLNHVSTAAERGKFSLEDGAQPPAKNMLNGRRWAWFRRASGGGRRTAGTGPKSTSRGTGARGRGPQGRGE